MRLDEVPGRIPCCREALHLLEHHLGNGAMAAGGFVELALRVDRTESFLPPEVRKWLELSLEGTRRISAVKRALEPCPGCGPGGCNPKKGV